MTGKLYGLVKKHYLNGADTLTLEDVASNDIPSNGNAPIHFFDVLHDAAKSATKRGGGSWTIEDVEIDGLSKSLKIFVGVGDNTYVLNHPWTVRTTYREDPRQKIYNR